MTVPTFLGSGVRAICLLEADFNWWNKLIFARRMMQQAILDGRIPQECFAKKHSIVITRY
jgi:hypothetical protein